MRHAEVFVDPQAHESRGVPLEVVLEGLGEAFAAAPEQRHGISARLIACFLRDRDPAEAEALLPRLLRYRDLVIGVGLDSAEVGRPPELFERVFARAADEGLHRVAHAGEEGPPAYVWSALDRLGVERIDHGIRSLEDPALVARLRADAVPLTVCPLSNVALRCVDDLGRHPLRRMLAEGLVATVNSDDPAYFGGYLHDNVAAVTAALGLTDEERRLLAANSFRASFLPEADKARFIARTRRRRCAQTAGFRPETQASAHTVRAAKTVRPARPRRGCSRPGRGTRTWAAPLGSGAPPRPSGPRPR